MRWVLSNDPNNSIKGLTRFLWHSWERYEPGLCSTHFFRTDSTLTHMTIQVTQLRLNSNPKFANLTQLRLNSKRKFTNLTQLWLTSFESVLSQIWLTTHHILPNLGKVVNQGGGVRSNVAAGWFFLCKVTDNCKILTFSLRIISDSTLTHAVSSWLNFDSSSIQLTQLWLKWQSAWFDSDSTHILDFHGRLDSNSTHLSQSRVKLDSRLMSRAQPWYEPFRKSRTEFSWKYNAQHAQKLDQERAGTVGNSAIHWRNRMLTFMSMFWWFL